MQTSKKILTTCTAILTAAMLNYCTPQEMPRKQETQTTNETQDTKGSLTEKLKPIIYKKNTSEVYGTNILYFDFSKIPFETVLQEGIDLPKDLEKKLNNTKPRIGSQQNFESLVWEEAAKIGYSEEKLSSLDCKEAVKAVMDITAHRIKYHDVDKDPKFIKQYGTFLNHDKYFELGLGDCDKYAAIAIGVFDMIKKINPNLKNAYLSNSDLGRNVQLHEWNSLIILREDSIILSHLDPTFYDKDGSLEADDYHINLRNNFFIGVFYYFLSDYKFSFDFNKNIFEKANWEEKRTLSGDMAFSACMLGSLERIQELIDLCEKSKLPETDKVLYYHFKTLEEKGFKEEAEKKRKELLEKFPDSFWVKDI